MKAESKFSIASCQKCSGPCMAINYTGDFRIHHPICLECYQKLDEDKKIPSELDMIIPEELSTEKAHEIQNNLDIAIDSLDGKYPDTIQKLQDIRDEIPCECGQEERIVPYPKRKRRR